MLDVDIAQLEDTVTEIKGLLRDGLIATDVWDIETGLSLAGHNPQPEATALFNLLTQEMQRTLRGSGFPGLDRYYILDLEQSNIVVCQLHGEDMMSYNDRKQDVIRAIYARAFRAAGLLG